MKENRLRGSVSGLILLAALAASACAEFWPCWRGPFFNGSTEAEGLPATWSKTENVAWVTPLPGRSAATPAVWGDRVFVSAVKDQTRDLLAICIDRKNGRVLWRRKLGVGEKIDARNTSASPSPVTDGRRVYFMYGTGELVALDFEGEVVWGRNLAKEYGKFYNWYHYAASPLLHKGRLYVSVLQRDVPLKGPAPKGVPPRDSFLLAVDPETGENLWRHVRPTDAVKESHEAYTTPIPYETEEGPQIIVVGGDYMTAHDPETGGEIWRWGGYNPEKDVYQRIIPSAVAGPGLIYFCAPRGKPLFAVRAGGTGRLGLERVAWKLTRCPPDVCTPCLYDGRLYVLDGDRKVMICLDPKSGRERWREKLGGRKVIRASPTAGDGKIYCLNENGDVWVLAAGDEFDILSRIQMGEGPCQSSIAIAGGQLFIRTARNLYCIGK